MMRIETNFKKDLFVAVLLSESGETVLTSFPHASKSEALQCLSNFIAIYARAAATQANFEKGHGR